MWFSLHRFSWNSLSVDGIEQRFPVPYCKELGKEMWRKLRVESHFSRISQVWPSLHRFSRNSLSVDGIEQRFPVTYCKELSQEMWRKLRVESHFSRISKVWPSLQSIFAKLTHAWLLVETKENLLCRISRKSDKRFSSWHWITQKKTEGRTNVRMWSPNAAIFMRDCKLHTRHVACHTYVAVWDHDHAGDLMTNTMMMIMHL